MRRSAYKRKNFPFKLYSVYVRNKLEKSLKIHFATLNKNHFLSLTMVRNLTNIS